MKLWQDFIYWLTIRPRLAMLRWQFPDVEISPAGSRYVCNPPSLLTDVDFLVYTEAPIEAALMALGYKESQFIEYANCHLQGLEFKSWRKKKVNLIVSSSRLFSDCYNVATHICKTYNLRYKHHRVLVHEVVRNPTANIVMLDSIYEDFDPGVKNLLRTLTGPHAATMREAYKAKHMSNQESP